MDMSEVAQNLWSHSRTYGTNGLKILVTAQRSTLDSSGPGPALFPELEGELLPASAPPTSISLLPLASLPLRSL